MLLLITGASGVGKSTVRSVVAPQLSPAVDCVELLDLTPPPEAMTQVWRQRAAEAAPAWRMHTIETTHMTKRAVADAVLGWCRQVLAEDAPTLRVRGI